MRTSGLAFGSSLSQRRRPGEGAGICIGEAGNKGEAVRKLILILCLLVIHTGVEYRLMTCMQDSFEPRSINMVPNLALLPSNMSHLLSLQQWPGHLSLTVVCAHPHLQPPLSSHHLCPAPKPSPASLVATQCNIAIRDGNEPLRAAWLA